MPREIDWPRSTWTLLALSNSGLGVFTFAIQPLDSLEAALHAVDKVALYGIVRCGETIMSELRCPFDFDKASVTEPR